MFPSVGARSGGEPVEVGPRPGAEVRLRRGRQLLFMVQRPRPLGVRIAGALRGCTPPGRVHVGGVRGETLADNALQHRAAVGIVPLAGARAVHHVRQLVRELELDDLSVRLELREIRYHSPVGATSHVRPPGTEHDVPDTAGPAPGRLDKPDRARREQAVEAQVEETLEARVDGMVAGEK